MYYATRSTDGTEHTIDIHAPDGRLMASLPYWDDENTDSQQVRDDARLIVDALNAFGR